MITPVSAVNFNSSTMHKGNATLGRSLMLNNDTFTKSLSFGSNPIVTYNWEYSLMKKSF